VTPISREIKIQPFKNDEKNNNMDVDIDNKKSMGSAKQSLENLDLKIPIIGEYKIGLNKVEILSSTMNETVFLKNGKKIVVRKLNNDSVQHELTYTNPYQKY
jgi:hypothetical protein